MPSNHKVKMSKKTKKRHISRKNALNLLSARASKKWRLNNFLPIWNINTALWWRYTIVFSLLIRIINCVLIWKWFVWFFYYQKWVWCVASVFFLLINVVANCFMASSFDGHHLRSSVCDICNLIANVITELYASKSNSLFDVFDEIRSVWLVTARNCHGFPSVFVSM